MRRSVLVLCMACLFVAASEGRAAQEARRAVFVAPYGKDSDEGTRERPLATLVCARDRVRELHAGQPPHTAIDVCLRAGRYELATTLELGPADSDTVWKACENERVEISGGRRVDPLVVRATDATDDNTADARAALPLIPANDGLDGDAFTWLVRLPEGADHLQFFVRDERRPMARVPREGCLRIASLPDASAATAWNEGQTSFIAGDGDVRSWSGLIGDAQVVAYHFWIESRMGVRAFDPATRRVELARRSTFRLTDDHGPAFARYAVENVLGKLERAGDWASANGWACYLSRLSDSNAQASVIVPMLRRLVEVRGDVEHARFVENLAFEHLIFEHSLAESHSNGWPHDDVAGPPQAAVTSPGALYFVGAHQCAVRDCELVHLGSYALELGAGCREVEIARNEIADLGAGGVKLGEPALAADLAHAVASNRIADNHLHDGGKLFASAVGILVLNASENTIEHNEVDHFFYTGLSIGWSWGYGASGAFGNRIEKNHVHHIGQGLLSDMGAIYTLGVSPGTVIRGNVFHDVESYSYGGWGIYFDEGTSGVIAEDNLVYRCKSNGFHQHYGKDNVVRNNVFALSREAQIARTRAEPHRSFVFENNVVYWSEGTLLSGNWDGDGYRFDRNVYWDTRGGFSLQEQRAHWQDHNSAVVDPRFVDPQHGDFRLQPDSPVVKFGFRPVDWSDVGPRPRSSR